MPLDPSTVYQNSKPADSFNPLTSLGKFAEIGNALETNKLLQQQEQYKAQANPININREQAALAMQRYDAYQKFFAPLAADPNLTDEKIMNYALKGIHDGLFSANEASAELMNVPRTPEQRQQWAADHMIRAQSAADQMKTVYGENQAATIGDKTLLGVRQSPMFGGGLNVATTLTHGLTPSENAAPRSMVISDGPHKGEVVTAPTSSYVDRTGHALSANADVTEQELQNSMPSNNPPSVAPTENIPAGGNIGTNVNEPKLPVGAVTTAFAPGESQSMERGAESGDNLRMTADSVPQRKALLGQMDALIKSGDFNSGPGADKWKELSAGLQRPFGIQSQSVASQEEFNKLAGMIAQEQFKTIGGTGTDTKFGSAMSTSPSSALSTLGNERIIALLKGNEDAIAIKNREWQKYKKQNGAGSYGDFSTLFNQSFDPRVFQASYMSPTERKIMTNSLSKKDLEQYKKDYQLAGENGWIK